MIWFRCRLGIANVASSLFVLSFGGPISRFSLEAGGQIILRSELGLGAIEFRKIVTQYFRWLRFELNEYFDCPREGWLIVKVVRKIPRIPLSVIKYSERHRYPISRDGVSRNNETNRNRYTITEMPKNFARFVQSLHENIPPCVNRLRGSPDRLGLNNFKITIKMFD